MNKIKNDCTFSVYKFKKSYKNKQKWLKYTAIV